MHPMSPLFCIFASLLHAAAAASTVQVASCAPKTCGNLTIAYPFWLPDQPPASPPPCGTAAFQVDCKGGLASLASSFRGAYRILAIFYGNRTVLVANANLPVGPGGGCLVPRIDVAASLSLAPFAASKANSELVFLYNCTKTPAPPGFVGVTCPGDPSYVRLDPNYDPSGVGAIAGDCGATVVPVMGFAGARSGDYVQLMRNGYLLEWRAPAGDCAVCGASGGRCGYEASREAFACICADGSSQAATCGAISGRKLILIVSMSLTAGLLLVCLVIAFKFRRQIQNSNLFSILAKNSSKTANVEKLLAKHGSLAPKRYRYSELRKITKSFRNKLGEGGYGMVFSGTLPDGRAVAVKFLHDSKANGEEFLNEVISIGRTSHVNIVTLLGFCLEGSKRALIYEYMPNGSLEKYVYSSNPAKTLSWEMLREIAVGIARGLEYLHEGCNTRIIHFDIKPHNILLDEGFRPKIADFGLAKLCSPKESILSMADARGTVGFIAPEVFSRGFGVISTKSDVYSYGMMLLEMVAGRSNAKAYSERCSELFFPLWIYDRLVEDGRLQDGEIGEMVARKMALVGLWCIQTMPANRPPMSKVLEMLERSIDELEIPPRPYYSSPLRPSTNLSLITELSQRSRLWTPESDHSEGLEQRAEGWSPLKRRPTDDAHSSV